ncbi:hypothetical protein C8R42DRAFT_690639 [Lentinula raphanica]|nr:hypothetical protein C8R42DRAFT_690639 [Lentinula raphanica]
MWLALCFAYFDYNYSPGLNVLHILQAPYLTFLFCLYLPLDLSTHTCLHIYIDLGFYCYYFHIILYTPSQATGKS